MRAHGTEREKGESGRDKRGQGRRAERGGEDRRTGQHERGPEEENDCVEEQCGRGRRGDGQQNLAGRKSKNESGGKTGPDAGEAREHRGWRLELETERGLGREESGTETGGQNRRCP